MKQSGRTWSRVVFWPIACSLVLASCARTPPEDRLREAVGEVEAAIEVRNVSALDDMLADDFIGPGGLDRSGARRMVQAAYLRYRDVGLTLGPLDIEVRGQHATVRFTAALTGARMFLDSGQVYDVETGWRLGDGEWQLVNANWRPKL